MKRLHFIIVALLLSMAVYSQNAAQARKILDKTAAVVGRKGGASASFSEGPFWRMICRLLSSTSKAGWFALDVINTNSFAKEQK